MKQILLRSIAVLFVVATLTLASGFQAAHALGACPSPTVITGGGSYAVPAGTVCFKYVNTGFLRGAMWSVLNGSNSSVVNTVQWYGGRNESVTSCISDSQALNGNGAQLNNFTVGKDSTGATYVTVTGNIANTVSISIQNWQNGSGCSVAPTPMGSGPTNTTTRTPTQTVGASNTPGGPTATSTKTPTRTNTPSKTATRTNTPVNTNTSTPLPTVDPHQVVNTYGRLQISNTMLEDHNGNAIQLRGMDSHGLTWYPLSDLNLNTSSNINLFNQQITAVPFPYHASIVGNLVTQWHIQVIKASLFPFDPWNGVNAKSYDNSYPTWKWYNINLVNSIVQAAIDQNIYVIIDWHAGEGNDPDPSVYWNNGHVQEFFTYMVDRWGAYPNVIYQTVNSPNSISWATLKTYNQNVINLIRSRETADGYAANLIIAGTPTWSQDVDVATNDPLTGNLIAYNFMWYAGTHGVSIRSKADTALANLATKAPNQTLFMSEVGTTQSTGTGGVFYTEFNTWLEWAKTNKLSWLNWSIADKEEDSAIFVPTILGNVGNNEIAWRGGDGASIPEALASTGFPMRIGPWASADYSCSGKFVQGWIMNNTSQSKPAGCP